MPDGRFLNNQLTHVWSALRRWGRAVSLVFESTDTCCTVAGDMDAINALPCEYRDGGRGRGHIMNRIYKAYGSVFRASAAPGFGQANKVKDLTER